MPNQGHFVRHTAAVLMAFALIVGLLPRFAVAQDGSDKPRGVGDIHAPVVVGRPPNSGKSSDSYKSDTTPDYIKEFWHDEFEELENQIRLKSELYAKGEDPYKNTRVLDPHACILPGDKTPFDVEYRRTMALIDFLDKMYQLENLDQLKDSLTAFGDRVKNRKSGSQMDSGKQIMKDYFEVCHIRRQVALSNPLLTFDSILFVGRGNYYGDDQTGQHQHVQALAFCNRVGGGLYILKNYKSNPEIIDVLENSIVQSGSYKGWKLSGKGSYYSPELSFDGKTILFSWSENEVGTEGKGWEFELVRPIPESERHARKTRRLFGWNLGKVGPIHEWPAENVFHIFKVNVDGINLVQLTEGPWNDFDPCFLPSGRIAFISERRGGYIRCFRKTLYMEVPNYVLHSMKDDGSDIIPLSYFETSEWAPSVDNYGRLIYTRWDYVDRENGLGSTFWTCFPDGRDPRSPHGNYPHPYSTRDEFKGPKEGTRPLGPITEMHFRAIPNSPRYIFTGVPHHGASFGPLALLDTRIRDEGTFNQITVITPDQKFPESQTREGYETDDRILKYGTPWPLSEDSYLSNYGQDLILLDRFGTRTILCRHDMCPNMGETMRPVGPIPVQARQKPPVIPVKTFQGERANLPRNPATISIMNINESDLPFPENRPVKWMRIVQLFLKTTPYMDIPKIGYGQETAARMSLGIVPAEEDGSVHCEAPVGKLLLFQALDENKMAIQSMRSATYVQPGENLSCIGCHEDQWSAPKLANHPTAFKRPPSVLIEEPGSQEPVSYYRTVKPIFQNCLSCHNEKNKGPQRMAYEDLEEYAFYNFKLSPSYNYSKFAIGGSGSRSIPGLVGAYHSKMGQALLQHREEERISDEEFHKVCLWLDLNSLRYGAYHDVEKQELGELVWPDLDVDPENITGVESDNRNSSVKH